MKKRYPSIQILRGVLFLFILAFHCGAPYANIGWGGVESFFVISAFFLVKKQYGNSELVILNQFKYRITRLYPPYLAVLFIAALYALLKKAIPYDLLTHLLSAQNFQWMITDYTSAMQPMTAHTWTLSIEVWTGLIWMILLKVIPKERFKISILFMLGLGVMYRVVTILCGASAMIVSLCPLAHLDAFACGSLLAVGYVSNNKENSLSRKRNLLVALSVVGLVGIVACITIIAKRNGSSLLDGYKLLSSSKNYLNNWFTGNIYLFISLTTTGIVGLLISFDDIRDKEISRIWQPVVRLGDNSYVLYLFHWPILVVLKHFVKNWMITFPIVLVSSIFATFVFTRLYSMIKGKITGGK